MGLWATRRQALHVLNTDMRAVRRLLDNAFTQLQELVDAMPLIDSYFRAAALAARKGKVLAHCMYSLTLDGNDKEARALFRVAIEAQELLMYLSQDPRRADQIVDNSLPSAGAIARIIGSNMLEVRKELSEHASHFGLTLQSIDHFFEVESDNIVGVRDAPFEKQALLRGLWLVFYTVVTITEALVACLDTAGLPTGTLKGKVEARSKTGLTLFAARGAFR